ncbi:MAG: FkbM family methyltransferase, partial [Gemmataceae bacterium]
MLKSIIKKFLPIKFRNWARTSLQGYIGYGELQANMTDLNSKFFYLQNKILETHGNNDKEAKLKVNSIFYITEPWWKRNFWEPAVQLALKDLIKSGSTVFDIGANLAGISILMSRLVGPKGTVCAFEASPRIIELTNGNIIASGLNNISLFNNAVYSESGKKISIYAGGHLNDS